jgi:hypothetical protein
MFVKLCVRTASLNTWLRALRHQCLTVLRRWVVELVFVRSHDTPWYLSSTWSCTQATIDVSTGLHPVPSHRSKSTLGTHPESDMFTDAFRAYASTHSNTVPKIKVPANVPATIVHATDPSFKVCRLLDENKN